MADVSKIKLPSGTTYDIKDNNALPLTGGSVTGPVSFGDTVTIDEATIGDLVVNGNGSFTNNIQANTINGVEVGAAPSFTDTITTVTTTGSGNAVTAITASNGALTVTKGTTFATGDTKVTQTAATASSYTYWRPLVIGMSAGSSAGFTPSTTTDTTYTFNTLEVQPSTGSIRVGNLVLYKGSYTATLTPETLTANRAITVPNKAGTIALTSDIPSVPAWALESSKPSYNFSEIGSKPTTISGYGITDAYTKTEVDNKVSAVLRYKGVKATVANLPTSGNTTGDVWHVTATSGEYAWDGTEWQELGTAISIPAATGSATTGISIADHSSTSIYGVSSSTTSVTGVSGSTSVYGVKSGTNSTTTASKASGANGTAPTLGTAISIYGVKSGTNSTTTASHVKSGGNGTAPTLGTAISLIGVQSSTTSVRGVKTGTNSTTTASKVTFGTAFSVPNPSFSDVTVPIRADADVTVPVAASSATTVPIKATSATTVPIKNTSATTIPNVTSVGTASSWTFESKTVVTDITFAMDTTDTKKLVITKSTDTVYSKSGGSNGTAPTLGTDISIIGVQSSTTSVTGVQSSTTSVTGVSGSTTVRGVKTGTSSTTTASKASLGTAFSIPNPSASDVTVPIRADADTTVPIKNANATSIPNVTSAGSASNWVFEDVTVPIRADSATSIPNVTSVGSASTWSFTDVTVPIRADSATTVPTAASSATTVPIKNGTATTVITSKTHSVTDNGHTHTI